MTPPLRFLSVCSDLGGAELAWEPIGWICAGVAEIDPAASAVLAHHWPHVRNFGDFTQIGAADAGSIDLLAGGTPCQSFSFAGLRAGLADSRGNLALEFLRLAHRTRPRWLVWENVPGVYSATSHPAPDPRPPQDNLDGPDGPRDGETVVVEDEYDADEDHAFSCFLAGVSELGYGFAYRTLDAQHFGVPQRRRRVFVVGYFGDWRPAAEVLFERHCLEGHPPPRRQTGQNAPTIPARRTGGGGLGTDFDCDGGLIAGRSESAGPYWDGSDIADTLDASNASNASKQQAMPEKRRFQAVVQTSPTMRAGGNRTGGDRPPGTDVDTADSLIITGPLCPGQHPGGSNGQDAYTDHLVCGALPSGHTPKGHGASGVNSQAVAAGHIVPVAFTSKDNGLDTGELSPTLRSMGHSVDVAFESRYARNGRGAPSELVPPLKAQSGQTGKGDAAPLVMTGMQVRRLTPKECERLQGIPDDHTLVSYRGKPMADGPRYKMIGNAWAIPVVRWIGERIQAVEGLIGKE